ncbi:MAG TPA: methyltransferase domain-containing protein [Burkholderiaceae bacterium]|nr:methyltransferase domain-containing protein [Burkholderiaceae bacterium]
MSPASSTARDIDAAALARGAARMARAEPPWLHGEVARRMAERLPIVRTQPARICDWWARAGGSAALLRAAYPRAEVVAVEREAGAAAAGKAAWWSAARWRVPVAATAEDAVGAGSAQLVWANMMLHHAPDPGAVFARWHAALSVEGFLMFSTLGPDTLKSLREIYRAAGWGSPHAAFTDMHDLGDMLGAAGFAEPVMDQETLRLTWATPEAALAELRGLGGNADAARFAGLRTPRWRARLARALAERASTDGRIGLEFEIVYGHAFKPAPRVAGETRVAADDLQRMARASRRGRL